jgi:Asp-tRNA(Asn)/Glu-tRNA(Gln) amidotransferase C subunit
MTHTPIQTTDRITAIFPTPPGGGRPNRHTAHDPRCHEQNLCDEQHRPITRRGPSPTRRDHPFMSQFDTTCEEIVASVRAGASIDESARQVDVAVASVRRWLRDGRKNTEGRYAAFAAAVDEARGQRKQAERAIKEGPLTGEEADLLIARAARRGSVPALRLWFEQRAADDSAERGASARELLAKVFDSDAG